MLEIKNYNNFILKDISFVLENNENLLILGENGAGKSTLAKVLVNLISNNSVFYEKENLSKVSALKRANIINYIPPKFDIFDEFLTLKEYLQSSFIEAYDYKKLETVIELLKLEKLLDSPCKLLSSGEKQLLLLASAILHNAQITIFDELTANLDITRLKDVFSILSSNSNPNSSSHFLEQKIIITHNLDFAYALKYKVLFIKNGKIEFFGSHDSFFSDENLELFYNKSIKKIENHLVVDL